MKVCLRFCVCEHKGTCAAREKAVWEREREGERRRKFGRQGLGFIINRGVIIGGGRRREGR